MPPEHTLSFTLPELLATAMAVHIAAFDTDLSSKDRLLYAKIALRFHNCIRDQNPDSIPNYRPLTDHLQQLYAILHFVCQFPQQN